VNSYGETHLPLVTIVGEELLKFSLYVLQLWSLSKVSQLLLHEAKLLAVFSEKSPRLLRLIDKQAL
jgi:hypothetical protein